MIKTVLTGLAVLLAAASMSIANERFYVVEFVDNTGETTYQVMSQKTYYALKKEVAVRNRAYPKALKQAKEEWKADEGTRKEGFPSSIFGKAEVKSLHLFVDKAKADEKNAYYQDKQQEQESRESGKRGFWERRLELLLQERKDGAPNGADKHTWKYNLEDDIKRVRDEISKRNAKDSDRESREDQARSLFNSILQKLIANPKAQ